MIYTMTEFDESGESQASILCRSCGLCCTGKLFIWAKLRPAELDAAEALGLTVFRSDPSQRGFSQPCPLWHGQCSIHNSPIYPHICRAYQCKLLKEVLAEKSTLSSALKVVEQVNEMIDELKQIMPVSSNRNFRENLVANIEHPAETTRQEEGYQEFLLKADALLHFYDIYFGVTDLFE